MLVGNINLCKFVNKGLSLGSCSQPLSNSMTRFVRIFYWISIRSDCRLTNTYSLEIVMRKNIICKKFNIYFSKNYFMISNKYTKTWYDIMKYLLSLLNIVLYLKLNQYSHFHLCFLFSLVFISWKSYFILLSIWLCILQFTTCFLKVTTYVNGNLFWQYNWMLLN